MYRCGWAEKDDGQQRVLGIDIKRDGFEWALRNASLSHGPNLDKTKPVRVQWDPERGIQLERLDYRSIQIGLTGPAVGLYVNQWIANIEDVTELASSIQTNRDLALLPVETPYPLPEDIANVLC